MPKTEAGEIGGQKNQDLLNHDTVENQIKYLKESWRLAVIQTQRKKPFKTGVKNSQGVK